VLVDLSREEAFPQRAEWHEADAELLERRQDVRLRSSPPQRVLALERCDRLNGVSAADRVHAGLGESEVPDLPFLDQVLHRARDVFDGHVRIDAVLVEQVDRLDPEAAQRGFGHLADVRRPAVEAALPVGFERERELGGDHDLVAEWSERVADELLVGEGTVGFGGVEEGDAAVDRRPDQ
jgi:hypothetical protein